MIRLLLDAHISPAVARGLQAEGIDAIALRDWQEGDYRSAPDERVLADAAADGRVLVSDDCRTLPPLLKQWAETAQHHRGVILVDERTISPRAVGALIRALRALLAEHGDESWDDRVIFLQAR